MSYVPGAITISLPRVYTLRLPMDDLISNPFLYFIKRLMDFVRLLSAVEGLETTTKITICDISVTTCYLNSLTVTFRTSY